MKKVLFTFLFLLISFVIYSQRSDIETNGQYYFTENLNSNESTSKFSALYNNATIKRKHIVQVISASDKEVVFKYLNFEKGTSARTLYNGDNQEKVFAMSIENFTYYTNPYYNRWRKWKVGVYTIPIRIRSANDTFEFESNLSLGANLIKGVNLSRYNDNVYIDFSVGVSLTKVNLTGDNSNIKNINPDLEKLSQGALTFSLGTTIHLAKSVNAGVFYGWDFLDGKEQSKLNWIHNAKPWIGFGINISFSDQNSNNKSSTIDQSGT